MGVFASTMRAERPLFDVEPQVETRFAWLQNRLFDLAYSVNLLTNEASTVVDSAARVATWKAEIETLKAGSARAAGKVSAAASQSSSGIGRPPASADGDDAAAAAAPPPQSAR